jgi:hypothetical protein
MFYDSFLGPIARFHGKCPVVPASWTKLAEATDNLNFTSFGTESAVDISSSSASDTAAGVGARSVAIFGMGSDYRFRSEIVAMNGQSVVTSTKKYLRIFSVEVASAGATMWNVGDIYIVDTGTGGTYTAGVPGTLTYLWIKCLAIWGVGRSGVFTVPAGCGYSVKRIALSSALQSCKIGIFVQNPLTDAAPALICPLSYTTAAGPLSMVDAPDPIGSVYPAGTDIYLKAIALTAGANVEVSLWLNRVIGTPGKAQVF